MTYFHAIATWDEDKRKVLLDWLKEEGLGADLIRDDGRFSVHNGRVSGTWFVLDKEGGRLVNKRTLRFVSVPFNVKQKNPLPEELL